MSDLQIRQRAVELALLIPHANLYTAADVIKNAAIIEDYMKKGVR